MDYRSPAEGSSAADDFARLEFIYRTARSLYRCWLSCKDAFPSSLTQDKWVVDARNEAYSRADARPNLILRQDYVACLVFCHM